MPLPYYEFTELENNKWQVTCSIERLNIKETVSGGARHEVRGLVAEKVLGVVGDKGVFDDSAENKLAEVNDLFKIKSTSKIYNLFKGETPILSQDKVQCMYNKAAPYLNEKHFKSQFRISKHTQSRLWELKLINSVMESGIILDKKSISRGQPDVVSNNLHIEVVLAELGSGDDEVELIPISDDESDMEMHDCTDDRRRKLPLRCTNSIAEKLTQRKEHIEKNKASATLTALD